MRGYTVTRVTSTTRKRRPLRSTTTGWLHTGDFATIDDGGYVRIVGRIKDMLIVGGFNVYPAEIENAMLAHPRGPRSR